MPSRRRSPGTRRPKFRRLVGSADPPSVVTEFAALSVSRAAGAWLPPANRYRAKPATELRRGLVQGEMREYVAVAGPLHCVDGWSYLGRALGAEVSGDTGAAIHLGYYAELRAAFSLLASQALCVLDDPHAVVQVGGVVSVGSGGGTHQMTWRLLRDWAGRSGTGALLETIVVVAGSSLGTWLGTFAGGAFKIGGAAADWISRWGQDLRTLADDRELRNSVSYNASEFTAPQAMGCVETSRFLRTIWQMCLPTSGVGFGALDRELLRMSLENARDALRLNPLAYAERVRWTVDQVATTFGTAQRAALSTELLTATPNPVFLAAAGGGLPVATSDVQVLSRALLLLRLATGASDLLVRPNARGELNFWWNRWAAERGLPNEPDIATLVAALIGNIDSAVNDLASWEGSTDAATTLRDKWRPAVAPSLWTLVTAEQVPIWSFGL